MRTYNLYKVTNTGNSSKNLQADVGMRGQHINVVLTQGVDDDRFAPVNQVSSNLKDLGSEIVLNYQKKKCLNIDIFCIPKKRLLLY